MRKFYLSNNFRKVLTRGGEKNLANWCDRKKSPQPRPNFNDHNRGRNLKKVKGKYEKN